MPNKCNARCCQTYIGSTRQFCRKHEDLIPNQFLIGLNKAQEMRLLGNPGSRTAMASAIAEAVEVISNKERASALRAASKARDPQGSGISTYQHLVQTAP